LDEIKNIIKNKRKELQEQNEDLDCWALEQGHLDWENYVTDSNNQVAKEIKRTKHTIAKYSRLYLERWRAIIQILLDKSENEYTDQERAKIVKWLTDFSNLWNLWQPPSRKKERDVWKFKTRKHFPNVNYAIRQVHRILGIKNKDRYFPIPSTTSSLKKLNEYWKKMAVKLNVPYFPNATSLTPTTSSELDLNKYPKIEEYFSKTNSKNQDIDNKNASQTNA
jgi:hypothetical protein